MRTESKAPGLRIVAGLDFAQIEDGAPYRPTATGRRQPVDDLATSATAENSRLRRERFKLWDRAAALARYWRALLDMETAIDVAESRDALPQSVCRLPCDRPTILASYREALAQQMRTPAYDLTSLKWKQDALAREAYVYTGVSPERLKQAIADDVAWLAAHPTRRTNSAAMARSREFKEAMRRRIREVAASRDLSDEEIGPALTLKHQEIARFSERHGVSIEWLLEGRERGRCGLMDILDGDGA